jgi:hypothetical protein
MINQPKLTIKDELKIIKEKCPIIWEKHFACECPSDIDDSLVNSYEINDYDDTYCDIGSKDGYCEKCWDKALGDDNK